MTQTFQREVSHCGGGVTSSFDLNVGRWLSRERVASMSKSQERFLLAGRLGHCGAGPVIIFGLQPKGGRGE